MKRHFLARATGLLLAAMALLPACAEYEGVDLQLVSNPPIPPEFHPEGILIVEGMGARVSALGFLNTGEAISDYSFELRSSDPSVFDVYSTDDGTWVFVGVGAGDAELLVRYDGSVEDRIRVRVREQAAPE